ncbi:hypothetical protein ACFL2Q_18770, partial [Thermodesulfobacteriota bacterium]
SLYCDPLGGSEYTQRAPKKTRIRAEEAVRDIRTGVTDEDMMEKYSLSAKGLSSLFRKLVAAQEIDQSELDTRKLSFEWAELAFPPISDATEGNGGDPAPLQATGVLRESVTVSRPSSKAGRYVAFVAVFLGGMLFVSVCFWMLGLIGGGKSTSSSGAIVDRVLPGDTLNRQVDRNIKILKAIGHKPPIQESPLTSDSPSRRSALEECLEDCRKDFVTAEGPDEGLLVNCRRECIGLHHERVRRMRQRYQAYNNLR